MEDRSEYYNFLVNLGIFLETDLGKNLVSELSKKRDEYQLVVTNTANKIVTETDLGLHKETLMKAASLKRSYTIILESELFNRESLKALSNHIKKELQEPSVG